MPSSRNSAILIRLPDVELAGDLAFPQQASLLVIFVHGSGSSRHSPRNQFVAETLQAHGFATLLFDLLTEYEDHNYETRFDIELLAGRLLAVTKWVKGRDDVGNLPLGYFGASTGAAAALNVAAEMGTRVAAVVSRGGRPDLVLPRLHSVLAPTLLIVGSLDTEVLALNRRAYEALSTVKELAIVQGATHLFEEPGTLEQVADLASGWFRRHCPKPRDGRNVIY